MSKNGFTLIELLITIVIIGLLAAIAVPAYVGTATKATRSEAYSNLESLRLLQEQRFADTAGYAPSAANTAAVEAEFPGFRPGNGANYWYEIVQDDEILSAAGYTVATPPTWQALTPCFVAIARGIANTRVANDIFTIDCNNVRNF